MKLYITDSGETKRMIVGCNDINEGIIRFIKKFYNKIEATDQKFKDGFFIYVCEKGFRPYDPDDSDLEIVKCQVE